MEQMRKIKKIWKIHRKKFEIEATIVILPKNNLNNVNIQLPKKAFKNDNINRGQIYIMLFL